MKNIDLDTGGDTNFARVRSEWTLLKFIPD